ncbi:hypothetical protein PYCC9005_001525 [Savitreella phatthalungensis]
MADPKSSPVQTPGAEETPARTQHDVPKELPSKYVNSHNLHSLELPKEVNDKVNAAREREHLTRKDT